MKRRFMNPAICLALLANSGCATIIKGGRQDVTVTSSTPGAEVSIKSFNGNEVYNGPPSTVRLQREYGYTVIVRAKGFKERKTTITKSLSGWAFGNLIWIIPILWGVGIAIDAASGALWSLDPDDLKINLLPADPEPKPPPPRGSDDIQYTPAPTQ